MADPNMLFEVFNVFEFWFNTLQLELFEFNCFDFSSGDISQLDSSRGGVCCRAFNGLQLSFQIMPMVMLIRIMLLMLNMVMIMMLIMIMIMPMMISMLIRTMIMMLIMSSLI